MIPLPGRYSVVQTGTQEQRILAKIMPSKTGVFVGTRTNIDRDQVPESIQKRINGVTFSGIEVMGLPDKTRAEELVDRFKASQAV